MFKSVVLSKTLFAGGILLLGLTSSTSVQAQNPTNAPAAYRGGPPTGWGISLSGGYVHNFDTGINGSGSFSRDAALIQVGLRYAFSTNRSAAFSLGYGLDHYNFSGASGLVSGEPWEDLHTIRLGAPVIWGVDDHWTLFVIPTLRFQGELGADLGEGISGGGFVGFSYQINDRLTIGPGFGAISQLEDNPSIFPVLIIDWKIAEKWSLMTGQGLGATLGPGVVLAYQPFDDWRFGIGARYEKFRFRLENENTAAPGGIGEDRNQPVFLTAEYSPNPGMSLSVIGGIQTGGELKLEDQAGNPLAESDYDTGAFAGFAFRLRF